MRKVYFGSWFLGTYSTVILLQGRKSMTEGSGRGTCSHHGTRKQREREVERNGTKARPKASRENIQSCSSMSRTLNKLWRDVNSKWLGCSCPNGIASGGPDGLSLGVTQLTTCSFLQQTFRVPRNFSFLGSPWHFGFTFTASFIPLSGAHCRSFKPSSEIWAEASCNSCILCACKISNT